MIHETWLKRDGFAGNLAVVVILSSPFLLGGSVIGISPLVLTLCAMAFSAGLAKDIINGVKDMDGNSVNRATLPLSIGVRPALMMAFLLLVSTILLSFVPFLILGQSILYIVFMGITDAILIMVMFTCFRRPNIAHHLQSLAMAVSIPGIVSISVLGW